VIELADPLPLYFEMQASVSVIKPTAGWKANAYLIFDYQGPNDFKFAGIDISINKLVMGHRDSSGWTVDKQSPFQAKYGTFYNLQLAINGTTASLLVNNATVFSHTYAARVVDGVPLSLNWGFVGVGSDNSRGQYDNLVVQVLPPEVSTDYVEDFSDGVADDFVGLQTGNWSVSSGRYAHTGVSGSTAVSLLDLGQSHGLNPSSYLEIQAQLNTTQIGGIAFDAYGTNDLKFVALDVTTQRVLIGHITPRNQWVIDAAVSRSLVAGMDYAVKLTLKGTAVSVSINGAFTMSYGFKSPIADGKTGTLARGGTTSFDSFRMLTNDAALAAALARPALGATAANMVATPNLDTNRDGAITPIDALLIINQLNERSIDAARESRLSVDSTMDANGDGTISPLDALLVINELNTASAVSDELLAAVASDVQWSTRRTRNTLSKSADDITQAEDGADRAFADWS
jgi:hypothetical protein